MDDNLATFHRQQIAYHEQELRRLEMERRDSCPSNFAVHQEPVHNRATGLHALPINDYIGPSMHSYGCQ